MATPKSDQPKQGVTTTELWASVAGGAGIYQIATLEGGPTMEQAVCAIAIAIGFGAYALSRALTKRGE